MSFSGLLTALVELVADVIVNDCGLAAPARVLRYHGSNGMPQDCCTDDGYLVIGWDRAFASASFPIASNKGGQCALQPVKQITLRYVTCWPLPPVDEDGVHPIDDEWDPKAATLADLEDCVTRALLDLNCSPVRYSEDAARRALQEAVTLLLRRDQFSYVESQPINPNDCAGVLWRVYAGSLPPEPVVS